jgi:ribosome biogenesis ATPase
LQVIVRKLRLSGDFDFAGVAARTPGFVGADLQALTKEAAAVAVSRIFSSLQQAPLASNLETVQVEVCTSPSPGITKRLG